MAPDKAVVDAPDTVAETRLRTRNDLGAAPPPGPIYFRTSHGSVMIHHVSRETMNGERQDRKSLDRLVRREKRKRVMRLRKLRGRR